jgi:hypothetical protein
MTSLVSQNVKKKLVYPYTFGGKPVTSDHTLASDDYAVGVVCSACDVTITVPAASTFTDYPKSWLIKKMSDDENCLILKLAVPSDSAYGAEFYAMRLCAQGSGVEIILNADGKYTFTEASGVKEDYIVIPVISTGTPSLASTTLTLNGTLDDLGVETSVKVRFRWRDVTSGSAWTDTSDATLSAVGDYSDTATVTAGHTFQAQAVVETDNGNIYYGDVLETTDDFYSDVGVAASNGLENYWAFQESAGVDTLAVDTMAGADMVMSGGVAIGSDTINAHTIYKRLFRADDFGEAPFTADFSAHTHTIMIQVDVNSASGDHTLFSLGRNVLSVASDGSSIQLEVNGTIGTWTSATPFSGVLNLFIVNDLSKSKCSLYTVTASGRTRRIVVNQVVSAQAIYFRLGRGAAGDNNHQDFEYLDDGDVRSVVVWGKKLTRSTMKSICDTLDTKGALIVS